MPKTTKKVFISNLATTLSQYWAVIQGSLFPYLEKEIDPPTEKQKKLITTLEILRIEEFLLDSSWMGRPPKFREAIARAFVAKSVYNMDTTRALIDRLKTDENLRRICGFESRRQIPSESTFSRAFDEFARSLLPQRVHEILIKKVCKESIIQHVSNDSTAIEARERPKIRPKKNQEVKTSNKRGRPKKGEKRKAKLPTITRLDKQPSMTLCEMLEDLPMECDYGCKKNSQGFVEKWCGYKLHIATSDGGVPISAILTSASMHDSQAAIPLMTLTSNRAINLYDLYDAAYYDKRIEAYSKSLNHVPIIDVNPRRDAKLKKELDAEKMACKTLHWKMPKAQRYNERSSVERTNGRLKDEYGGRNVRVKGKTKVLCHLMFGLLALTVDQLMIMVT